jgi:hypothetical protein
MWRLSECLDEWIAGLAGDELIALADAITGDDPEPEDLTDAA